MTRRILLVDWSTENNLSMPDPWWRAFAVAAQGLFTKTVHCRVPDHAFNAIDVFDPEPGDEVQFWCHGVPGRPLIGGQAVGPDHLAWKKCAGAKVWFRSCDVARMKFGKHFMNALADKGIHVAGHLATIGLMGHSYLVGVSSGEEAWWPESFDGGSSGPFKPRTVLPLTMSLPTWAFDRGGL